MSPCSSRFFTICQYSADDGLLFVISMSVTYSNICTPWHWLNCRRGKPPNRTEKLPVAGRKKLDHTHGSIRRFEKGESGMTVATLARLKDALGCSWEDLLDGCGSKVVKERIVHFRK